jgi:hypothetical protein
MSTRQFYHSRLRERKSPKIEDLFEKNPERVQGERDAIAAVKAVIREMREEREKEPKKDA